MKNIAILGKNSVELGNSLCNFFRNRDIEVVVLSEMIDIEYLKKKNFDLIILDFLPQVDLDLESKIIHLQPSLLPSFPDENAIEEIFVSGVKVSGVTVYSKFTNGEKSIIAQYPVLLGLDTTLNDFEQDILDVEKKLLPIVADAIINDKVFDFHDLLKNPCKHSTGGCTNCSGCGGCE